MARKMICISGIGWIFDGKYGCARTGHKRNAESDLPPSGEVFPYPFKNFGRLDPQSRVTCCAVGLALRDARIELSPNQKKAIGIVGTCSSGSLASDIKYFRDYIDSGRTLGRGHLFIYTLPSSPLAEAAVYFGCLGPLLYIDDRQDPFGTTVRTASEMIRASEAGTMVAGVTEEEGAAYFVLQKAKQPDPGCHILPADQAMIGISTIGDVVARVIDINKHGA